MVYAIVICPSMWYRCSIPVAEWLDSSVVGIAQLAHAAGKFILCHEGGDVAVPKWLLGGLAMICIWSSWCHFHRIISCFLNIQYDLPFWCRLPMLSCKKRPLNDVDRNLECHFVNVICGISMWSKTFLLKHHLTVSWFVIPLFRHMIGVLWTIPSAFSWECHCNCCSYNSLPTLVLIAQVTFVLEGKQTDKWTKWETQLITIPTPQLPVVWVIIMDWCALTLCI